STEALTAVPMPLRVDLSVVTQPCDTMPKRSVLRWPRSNAVQPKCSGKGRAAVPTSTACVAHGQRVADCGSVVTPSSSSQATCDAAVSGAQEGSEPQATAATAGLLVSRQTV